MGFKEKSGVLFISTGDLIPPFLYSMNILFFNMIWEMSPLGLLHIITYLEKNGYPAKHIYLTKTEKETKEALNSILLFVQKEIPDLIGFSLMTFNFERTKIITRLIKDHFPEIPVVWGGIHPTFNPGECIQYADYICIGEGEDATLELVQAIKYRQSTSHIQNIWSKDNNHVIKNDVRH